MALFKINKGPASNLGAVGNPTEVAQEGFAYFTPDDGKFYIDIENANEAIIGDNRIPINSYLTDKFSSDKIITLTGDVTGTDASDATTGWTIATTLRNSGVIDGIYGPDDNDEPTSSIVVPRLTINEKGLITSAESVEIDIATISDTKVTQTLESDDGSYFPLFTPKNQSTTTTTTSTFNRYVKVNPNISEWTFLTNDGDNHHDTPSFIISRSSVGANLKLWGQSGDFYISTDYWVNSKKQTFSEHFVKFSPSDASITFQGHLLPNSSGWALGDALHRWEAGFFNQGVMINGSLDFGSTTTPIYWNNGVPTPITSYSGTAARAIADEDGNNIKQNYAANLTFTNGLLMLKNKNGTALDSISLGTLTTSDITTGTEEVSKFITAKVVKDSITSLINTLNVAEKTFSDGEVLKTIKEENGKISLTTGQLSVEAGVVLGKYIINLKEDGNSFSQANISTMTGASVNVAGQIGLVPQPIAGDQEKFLRGDGTWVTPDNTDTAVTQTISTDDNNYRVLLSYTADDLTRTEGARKDKDFYYNPSSNTLTVTQVNGNALTASKANADGMGNNIVNTYATKATSVGDIVWNDTNKKITKTINGTTSDVLAISAGDNITLTAANGSITIASANDDTTYGLSGSLTGETFVTTLTTGGTGTQSIVPKMTAATANAAGRAGLVPAPSAGDETKFLTGAGTWVAQTVYELPLASSSTRGGIKIGYSTNATARNYAVQLSSEKAYVNVPWTDNSVTAPMYHYTPEEVSNQAISVNATGATAAWGIDVVKGVTLKRDSKGHVVGMEIVSGKIPDQPTYPNDRDPGYGIITIGTASTAVTAPTANANTITAATYKEKVTFSATNKWISLGATDSSTSGSDKVYFGHILSGVTKGNYGPSADVSATNGGSFTVPYVSVDEAGHVTGISTKTITLPTITDTKVTQQNFTNNSNLRVILSHSATGNTETDVVYKSNNLLYNPNTNILSAGNIVLSDDLSIGGDVDVTGSLDVTGNAAFTQIPTAPTATAGSNDTKLATTAFVSAAVAGIVGPMRFIGTLGSGGTITALPSASNSNKGYTYKVITGGRYGQTQWEQDAIYGDVVISNGSQWILIPSGDEPSGTVTNIATGNGLTGGPITSTGTISHADTSNQASVTTVSNKYISAVTLDTFGHVTGLSTATISASGTHADDYYVKRSGDTMTGLLTLQGNQYGDSYSGALNMNNSNIYGLNAIYTADVSDNAAEGINFYRDATHVDTLWINGGDLLFVPNRALGSGTSKNDSQKVGRFTVNPSSGQVVITDGTTGGMKSSGYTIEKSVPSNAVFTDTWVALSTSAAGYAPKAPNDTHKFLRGDATWTDITAAKSTTLAWNTESTIATVGGYDIKVKLPANPNTNTDTLVKQTAKTDNVNYKILTTVSASPTSGNAAEAAYDTDITLNPSTNTITAANFEGSARNAKNTQSIHGQKEFTINGDANTYYPTLFAGFTSNAASTLLNIHRNYHETAPDTWNTATHKGGLTLTILSNGDSAWGGNHSIGVTKLNTILILDQTYCTMVGDIQDTNFGLVVWLRGGGAKYHVTSNGGQAVTVTTWYESYTASSNTVAPITTVNTTRINDYRWKLSYTPAGTNVKSAVTIKPTTTNIYSITGVGTPPSLSMSVDETTETLSFTWSAGTVPTRSSAIAAWTGYTTGVDNTYAAAQVFTGTQATLTF